MASDHVDRLLRTLATSPSRRTTLRALGALTLGLAAVPVEEGAARSCGPCKTKKRGKCKGKLANGTACNSNGFCVDGVCQQCLSYNEMCYDSGSCCGYHCNMIPDAYNGFCAKGPSGAPCRTADDCFNNACVDSICQ
jgi:hypothetical protein